jgi:hypothetical protein
MRVLLSELLLVGVDSIASEALGRVLDLLPSFLTVGRQDSEANTAGRSSWSSDPANVIAFSGRAQPGCDAVLDGGSSGGAISCGSCDATTME